MVLERLSEALRSEECRSTVQYLHRLPRRRNRLPRPDDATSLIKEDSSIFFLNFFIYFFVTFNLPKSTEDMRLQSDPSAF